MTPHGRVPRLASAAASPKPAHLKPVLRLLLVEDNPDDATLVRLHLARGAFTYDIREAGTLKDGLAAGAAEPVVALLDLDLPDSRGLDTVKAWRHALPDVPVVVMTGRRDRHLGLNALAFGVHGFVAKDEATTERLESSILQAVQRARLQSGFTAGRPKRKDGGLRIQPRDSRLLGRIDRHETGDPPIVYVTFKDEAEDVRRKLAKRGVPAAGLSLVSVAAGPTGTTGFGHVQVGRANVLEDLLVAVETGCARMGPGCRVIVDDLEALANDHDDERCAEFLRTLSKRLTALGVPGEVLVKKGAAGRLLDERFAPSLEN